MDPTNNNLPPLLPQGANSSASNQTPVASRPADQSLASTNAIAQNTLPNSSSSQQQPPASLFAVPTPRVVRIPTAVPPQSSSSSSSSSSSLISLPPSALSAMRASSSPPSSSSSLRPAVISINESSSEGITRHIAMRRIGSFLRLRLDDRMPQRDRASQISDITGDLFGNNDRIRAESVREHLNTECITGFILRHAQASNDDFINALFPPSSAARLASSSNSSSLRSPEEAKSHAQSSRRQFFRANRTRRAEISPPFSLPQSASSAMQTSSSSSSSSSLRPTSANERRPGGSNAQPTLTISEASVRIRHLLTSRPLTTRIDEISNYQNVMLTDLIASRRPISRESIEIGDATAAILAGIGMSHIDFINTLFASSSAAQQHTSASSSTTSTTPTSSSTSSLALNHEEVMNNLVSHGSYEDDLINVIIEDVLFAGRRNRETITRQTAIRILEQCTLDDILALDHGQLITDIFSRGSHLENSDDDSVENNSNDDNVENDNESVQSTGSDDHANYGPETSSQSMIPSTSATPSSGHGSVDSSPFPVEPSSISSMVSSLSSLNMSTNAPITPIISLRTPHMFGTPPISGTPQAPINFLYAPPLPTSPGGSSTWSTSSTVGSVQDSPDSTQN